MNKLAGFYELRESSLPVVPWKEYNLGDKFSDDVLWTIRTAVKQGNDIDLPRKVGCTAKEAEYFAKQTWRTYKNIGMVVYYPYFIARKSGTLCLSRDGYVIEAVNGDLWSLVNHNNKNCTLEKDREGNLKSYAGEKNFLTEKEQIELHNQTPKLRRMFKDELQEGSSVLVEWSYAVNCNSSRVEVGDPYLVFYEARTI